MPDELQVCGQLAHKGFRGKAKAEGMLITSCCCEPGHTGNHVYGMLFKKTINFVEETKRSKLTTITHVDLKPGAKLTEEEVQGLYQYLEYARELRSAEQEGT